MIDLVQGRLKYSFKPTGHLKDFFFFFCKIPSFFSFLSMMIIRLNEWSVDEARELTFLSVNFVFDWFLTWCRVVMENVASTILFLINLVQLQMILSSWIGSVHISTTHYIYLTTYYSNLQSKWCLWSSQKSPILLKRKNTNICTYTRTYTQNRNLSSPK